MLLQKAIAFLEELFFTPTNGPVRPQVTRFVMRLDFESMKLRCRLVEGLEHTFPLHCAGLIHAPAMM